MAVDDMKPKLISHDASFYEFINLIKFILKSLKSFSVISYLGIGLITVIDDDSFNWSFEIYLYKSQFLLVANNYVLDQMRFKLCIIYCDIKFLFPKNVFTSQIASLFDLQLLDGIILIILYYWSKNVDSTSEEPLVAPIFESEIRAHRFIL